VIPVLITLALIYLGALIAAAYFSIRPFRTPLFISPGAMGAAQETLHFRSREGHDIQCWWMPADGAKMVVVFAHGYMMNRSEPTTLAVELWKQGYSCFLFDFPAHGRSGGRTVGFGWLERVVVQDAIQQAKEVSGGLPVVVWGSSMGAAASAFALAEGSEGVCGVMLDSSYSRLSKAVGGWWYFVGGRFLATVLSPILLFARLMVPFNPWSVDVAQALKNVKIPTLFLHGGSDTLATPAEAKRNLSHAPAGAEMVWFEGCGHSEGRWVDPARYRQAVQDFLKKIEKSLGEPERHLVE